MAWDRKLWGVMFTGALKADQPMLLGDAWHQSRGWPKTPDIPSRAMLFMTRAQARQWCSEQHAMNKGRQDCCAKWRFRPVRVRETVKPAPAETA